MPDITFASNYRHGWPSAARYWTSEFDDTCSNFDARLPNLYNTCRRGRRSGLKVREREIHHRNPIQTIVTDSEHAPSSRLKGINVNNLIQVELRNQPVAKEKSKPLAMAVVNCRSLNKNGLKLKDHIVEYNCDIVAVTETWLPCEDILANQIIGDVCPKGYKISQVPRETGHRGGGVGIIYKKSLEIRDSGIEQESAIKYDTFEHSHHLLKLNSKWIRIVTIYRPPPSTCNGFTVVQFLSEFAIFLESLISLPGQLLILGDVNFHLEDTSASQTREFLELLDVFNLKQLVNKPTHRLGHTLDCIITEESVDLVEDISVHAPWISDHSLVAFTLSLPKPVLSSKHITTRNWKSLDLDKFKLDITNSDVGNSSNSVAECAYHYDSTLRALIDAHAPARRKTILLRPRAPWYTQELSEEKRVKRRLERRYRSTETPEDAQRFKEQCFRYSELLSSTREVFYNNKILENSGDQKALFTVVNKLLHRTSEPQLPAHDDSRELANRFVNFFVTKISNIRSTFAGSSTTEPLTPVVSCRLSDFSPVTKEEIQTVINKSNSKCCSLDPIPTWLLKKCLSSLLPIITNIVNQSLTSSMPSCFKEAILTPILKKSDLDKENLKNYRPISNLSYVSKLIEKVVARQMTNYFSSNNLDEAMQSAYRANHSTETALCKIHNDINLSLDRNECVLLIALDLSAAFDTIDHPLLLARLAHRFGVTGRCLHWIKSYLQERKMRVAIDGTLSDSKDLCCGVPQGSVLGPKLFTMYLIPLGDIARNHGVRFHAYADDCQLYIAFLKETVPTIKSKMENLLVDVKKWMTTNMLKLNDDKTEIIALDGPRRTPVELQSLTVGNEEVVISKVIRLLGVDIDANLSLKHHVCNVAKKCLFMLKNMFKIRKCVDDKAAKAMVHTLITTKLDYCNAILYGLPEVTLKHLIRVQRMSARLIAERGKHDHITEVLQQLHWLPIRQRIHYKVLVLTFKSIHGLAPSYLEEIITKRPMKRTRADANNDLVIPAIKHKTLGGRTFAYGGPKLWNSLPKKLKNCTDINIFKRSLKTFLFKQAYDL